MSLMYISCFLLRWAPEEGHSRNEDVAGDAEGTDVRARTAGTKGAAPAT
jgi:hypothetical protein